MERSRVVLLATRPGDLHDAIVGLPWRPDQTAVSVAAGARLSSLEPDVRPAKPVRALPVTAAQIGESPTCLVPDDSAARELFEGLGTVHAFADETVFEAACIHGVVYSVFHAVIRSTATWFESAGLPEGEARGLAALTIRAAAGMVVERSEVSLDAMIDAFAQPGTLTRVALQQLGDDEVLERLPLAWRAALERSREIAATFGV